MRISDWSSDVCSSDLLCLLREEGSFPLKSRVLLAGDRHPLGVGGGSQAMLAALGDAEVAYCLDQNMPDISRIYPRYTRDILMDLVRQGRKKIGRAHA